MKRTKSVTKLERTKRGPGGGLRGSRSHESLLSSHAVMSTIDLSCTGAVGVAPVHQSVLGRRHCFQVRGGPRGERYYSCGSRQERDIWIYSLRKSIAPNAEHTRRTDNSLRMWIYEAKALPPKKKYFCEINLDKTLYGRTSVKLRSDLLFWGEYFDFPDIPEINVIHVNVFREGDKKKKRDKHTLVGAVKIPIHDVTSRATSEDWYPIVSEKHDSISRNSTKEPIPTLRIKCRFQSIDILPIDVYNEFLMYLKDNYKKVCEILEPVIGVKAKEDIGQALVLLMHAQGMAAAFLTDVVALDLLRVGDQRLTFRGNSLATKSMEAFLKLTGEQYLQDTLSTPISEIIASDRDCEVDPLKATGSLSRQQQALRNAVKISWNSIAESHKLFPPQLRDCFATFRERLQMLDREDMADNLISASIFLRFLCPAILSPSLFNITNELPSGRATRNLTLVAKTLQTLANFTRFQGKENFMEFLNDFLEQEAGKMKEFLHLISTRDEHHPMQESIMDWSGYIDQGKQLSILHSLLSEAIQKLPLNRQQDLGSLTTILDDITKAKESNNFDQQMNVMASANGMSGDPHIPMQHQPRIERGIMRGVLTPSSLEKNIFRYNDPTVAAQLQHSHSASSIAASVSNHNINHTNSTNNLIPNTSVYNGGDKRYLTNSSNSSSYYNASTISSNGRKSPAMSQNGIRANTLPRNNNNTSTSGTNGISTVEIRNNKEEINSNLIQIGLDPSNAFLRKSPTPLMKSTSNRGMVNRGLNGSQISLLSERPIIPQHQSSSLLNLGIPHNQVETTSNMPMNLEDLEDLIKYADEQNELLKNKDNITISNGKGSNISIGVCSSGYQSITTQSQSSSPIEQTNCLSVVNNNHQPNQSRMNALTNGKYQYIKYPSTSSSSTNSNSIIIPTNNNNGPLIHQPYKTPLYHVQSQNHSNNNHSSLTPSSSDENLCHEFDIMGSGLHHNHHGLSSSLKTNGFSSRIPRTNPMAHYKRGGGNNNSINNNNMSNADSELPIEINSYVSPPVSHHLLRYQRRLSLESARTLSDSSTDTEGHLCPADTICHSNTIESGKRRRAATNGTSGALLSGVNGGGHHRGGGSGGHHSDRSVEQCERQIERLQASVDSLRHKLEESDLRESNDDLMTLPPHSDSKMRSIISRLISMEEELRREQLKMSLALTHKQRVIEAQVQQIAALDAANNRLLTALSSLRKRYETQQANNLSNQQQSLAQQQQSPQQSPQQQQQPANAGGSGC